MCHAYEFWPIYCIKFLHSLFQEELHAVRILSATSRLFKPLQWAYERRALFSVIVGLRFQTVESCRFYFMRHFFISPDSAKWSHPFCHHLSPFQIYVHMISEFSSLDAFFDTSKKKTLLLFLNGLSKPQCSRRWRQKWGTPNNYAAWHWLLPYRKA